MSPDRVDEGLPSPKRVLDGVPGADVKVRLAVGLVGLRLTELIGG